MMLRKSLILLIAILATPVLALAQRGGARPASVFVETVELKAFSLRLEALGTLEANERVDLTLNAADRVTAIFFDDGDRVVAGKTLLSLAQREQTALVEAAEADVEEARRQFERLERLAEASAVSKSELDAARGTLDSARANLRAVQSRQKDRVLVAPFDGVLGFRQVSVGSYIQPGTVVATLIDDSEMNLDFTIPSTFLRTLAPGTEIRARTDDFPGEVFNGTVQAIDNAIDPVTRSVRVRAVLPNPDLLLRPGMFMQVTLIADPRMAPAIPEEAIQSIGPDSFVFFVDETNTPPTAHRRKVELGLRENGDVEAISGLKAGDKVVSEGLIRVREGIALNIKDKSLLMPDGPTTAARNAPDTPEQQ